MVRVESALSITVLIHRVWLGLLLSDVGERADDGDAVGQFLLVLVVMLFEKSIADFPTHLLSDSDRRLVLVENHVCPIQNERKQAITITFSMTYLWDSPLPPL